MPMSDRDRIAEVVRARLDASGVAGKRWRMSMAGSIANALIAAGCRMPETPCGASAVIAGIEYVCDREQQHPEPVHECTDGVGVTRWRDSDSGPVVVAAWVHDGSDGWPIR